MTTFWQWFDSVLQSAPLTEVGKLATAQGFSVAHTGGGCLAWEKVLTDEHYLWICDLGNGLGETVTETYLVGYYNRDADVLDQGDVEGMPAALAWCQEREVSHG